jgi:hypothetical protein
MKIYADIEQRGNVTEYGEKATQFTPVNVPNGATYVVPDDVHEVVAELQDSARVQLPIAIDNVGRKIRVVVASSIGNNFLLPTGGDTISGTPFVELLVYSAFEVMAVDANRWIIINKA